MSRCAAFSRIVWTCARYSYIQPLKSPPFHYRWLCNFRFKSICAVADLSSRTATNGGTYVNSVGALVNRDSQSLRYFSSKAANKTDSAAKESSPGLLRRFHQTYKEHGKILVCVHLVTSAVWAGIFYFAAVRGVDVVPLLKSLGASERIILPFTKPGVELAAVTYLLYKLATPLRYTVTIGGTHLSVKYLRRWGYLPPIASSDTIRSMVKTKIGEVRDQQSHRFRSRKRRH